MLFTIVINQLAAVTKNAIELDLNEIAVLNVFKDAQANPKIETYWEQEKTWYWISNQWVKKALPLVFKPTASYDTVYRKVKKLVELGYVESNTILSQKKNRSYYRLTEKGMSLFQSTEVDFQTIQNAEDILSTYNPPQKSETPSADLRTPLRNNSEPLRSFSEGPSADSPNDYNITNTIELNKEDSNLFLPNDYTIPAREKNFKFPFREFAKGMANELISEYYQAERDGVLKYWLHEYRDYFFLEEGLSGSGQAPATQIEILNFLKSDQEPKQFYLGQKVVSENKSVSLSPIYALIYPFSCSDFALNDLKGIPSRYATIKLAIKAKINADEK